MAVFEIKSFRGGISDYSNRGPEGSFKFASNIDIRKNEDTLSCQQTLVDENGTFTGIIRFFVVASDGNQYGFDNVGKIYKRDSNKDWSLVYTDPDGAIKGAAEWPSDAGVSYLVWATDTKLKCKELPGASNWSDVNARSNFPRTDLDSTDWHTMRSSGGDLIILNKNKIAALGYDSSYSPNVTDLVPGNVGKSIVERHARTIIGTTKPATPNNGINAMIEAEVPLSQVGNNGELYYSDMVETQPATRFPGGGRVNPGGVCLDTEQVSFFEWAQAASSNPDINSWIDKKDIGGMSLWAVFSADTGKGGIYTYGRKRKNHPFVLNLDYQFDADELGAICYADGDILVSYRQGSNYGVKRIDTTTKAIGTYKSLESPTVIKKEVEIINWKRCEVFMKPLPSGCSIAMYYKLNKGSWVQAYLEGQETSFDDAGAEKAVFLIGAQADIFEVKLVLNPHENESPEINRIRVYFD